MPRGVDSAPGSRVAVRSVQHHDPGPQPDGQVAQCWVQGVADPSAAMQQLKDKIVLVAVPGTAPSTAVQLVAQSSEPPEPVEPSHEIVMATPPARWQRTGN